MRKPVVSCEYRRAVAQRHTLPVPHAAEQPRNALHGGKANATQHHPTHLCSKNS
jgi:hypothetical protein